ncbi:hypothetical protein [Gynuella sp.]|uniref:hypothetical protein n=1 Tax=Gynuella sp. TaxID=2969146 RepID=UPI003D10E6B9
MIVSLIIIVVVSGFIWTHRNDDQRSQEELQGPLNKEPINFNEEHGSKGYSDSLMNDNFHDKKIADPPVQETEELIVEREFEPSSQDEPDQNDYIFLSLSPVVDSDLSNTQNIPDVFVNHGDHFDANLSLLHQYPVGTKISVEIFGNLYEGAIKRHKTLDSGVSNTRIDFGYESPPSYMTIYSYTDGRSTGNIYTKDTNYTFWNKDQNGFLIEDNRLHELSGFPLTD